MKLFPRNRVKLPLKEGLITSYPADSLLLRLKMQRWVKNLIINPLEKDTSTVRVSKHISNKEELLLDVEFIEDGTLVMMGYFVAAILITLENNKGQQFEYDFKTKEELERFDLDKELKTKGGYFTLQLEPKFDTPISVMPDFVYHITIKQKVDKILKQGLVPKSYSKQTNHPDRIYVVFDKGKAQNLARKMTLVKGDKDLVLLKIDLRNSPINFYKDPQLGGAAYCIENISPNLISLDNL